MQLIRLISGKIRQHAVEGVLAACGVRPRGLCAMEASPAEKQMRYLWWGVERA
jgi:hypothetical protein